MKKPAITLAMLVTSGFVFAQATASSVQGLVTATSGNQLTNVTEGMSIPDGSVVSATSNGSATISMPGCSVTLRPGQSLTVDDAGCKAFLASSSGAGAGGSGISTNNMLLGAAGVGLLAYNVNRNRNNNGATVVLPVTPTTPGTPATPAVVVRPTPISGR